MDSFERLAPEQHDSLPDVAEPAENPRLIGHRDEATRLATAYRSGHLHHALLLFGPRGIGKATLAYAFARHLLNYPDQDNAPDELVPLDTQSALFRQIASGAHPSLLHLTRPLDKDGKKFKTAITVDEIRRVSKFLSMTSHDGGYRVAIVDPADDMNVNAANALLKNLEEPPPRTLFMLVSHAPGRLLPTIRSRCQSIRLQPLGNEDLLSVLTATGEVLPADAAARGKIVELAEGCPRNALLMTRYGGMELTQALNDLLAARQPDIAGAYKLAEAVSSRDADIQFSILNEAVLDLIAKHARHAGDAGQANQAANLSDLWHEAREAIQQTTVYNLDKKQHVVGLLTRLRQHITH